MEWTDYSESPLLYLPLCLPSAITGWQGLAHQVMDFFENNQGGVHSIKAFMP